MTAQAAVPIRTAAEEQLAANWQQAKSGLPGPVLLRSTAFERFAMAGLPHRRQLLLGSRPDRDCGLRGHAISSWYCA